MFLSIVLFLWLQSYVCYVCSYRLGVLWGTSPWCFTCVPIDCPSPVVPILSVLRMFLYIGPFRKAPGGPRMPQDTSGGHRKLQDVPGGSKMPKEAPGNPKMPQEAPGGSVPRKRQEGTRKPQEAPGSSRSLQEAQAPGSPRRLQESLRCPRKPQETAGGPRSPKRFQEAPESSRKPQEAPGTPGDFRKPQEAPRDSRRIQSRSVMLRPLTCRYSHPKLSHAQAHAHILTRTIGAHTHSNSCTVRFTPRLSIFELVYIQSLLR